MFKILVVFFFVFRGALFAADYDCAIVGSSPVLMLEALYQAASGKRVLLLERDAICGGAWRSIDACGISHVDMGCHQIGGTAALANFLERLGCNIVSMSDPTKPYNPLSGGQGLYFSQGCYELVSLLEAKIRRSSIDLKLNSALDRVSFENGWAVIETSRGEKERVKKIYFTNGSSFFINDKAPPTRKAKYYHLYLLIADGGDVRCSYRGGFTGVSRIMNLTRFANLYPSGLQLIVLQVYNEGDFKNAPQFLESLKKFSIVDSTARIIQEESYIYEQTVSAGILNHLNAEQKSYFEHLDASHLFNSMNRYLERWSMLLP